MACVCVCGFVCGFVCELHCIDSYLQMIIMRPGKFLVGDNVVSLMKVLDVFVGKEPSRNRRSVSNMFFLCDDYLQLLV
jgi:hypothetical protein